MSYPANLTAADLAAVRAASLTRLMPQVEVLMRLTATVELPQFKAEKGTRDAIHQR